MWDEITYPCWDLSYLILVKWTPGRNCFKPHRRQTITRSNIHHKLLAPQEKTPLKLESKVNNFILAWRFWKCLQNEGHLLSVSRQRHWSWSTLSCRGNNANRVDETHGSAAPWHIPEYMEYNLWHWQANIHTHSRTWMQICYLGTTISGIAKNSMASLSCSLYNVMKWKRFLHYWNFVTEIHRSSWFARPYRSRDFTVIVKRTP